MTDDSPHRINFDSRPVPDPTVLTTEQLQREIANTIRILDAKRDGVEDKLIILIESLKETTEIQFKNIDLQFAAIEAWRKEQKLDTKTAVDAALQAAEKAVREQTVASEKAITKSETAASEQSKQQYATFTASLKGVADTLADVKDRVLKVESMTANSVGFESRLNDFSDRLTRAEAVKLGMAEQKQEVRSATNNTATVVGIVISAFVLLGILGTVAVALAEK